jgi:hypothetical protein
VGRPESSLWWPIPTQIHVHPLVSGGGNPGNLLVATKKAKTTRTRRTQQPCAVCAYSIAWPAERRTFDKPSTRLTRMVVAVGGVCSDGTAQQQPMVPARTRNHPLWCLPCCERETGWERRSSAPGEQCSKIVGAGPVRFSRKFFNVNTKGGGCRAPPGRLSFWANVSCNQLGER